MSSEFKLHKNIAEYLRLQYPGVIFLSTLNGIRLPIGQAVQMASLQCGRGLPDVVILEPRRGYCGLCGEIKTADSRNLTVKGELRQTQHIQEQGDMIRALEQRGYCARFWIGFDDAKECIDWYLEL